MRRAFLATEAEKIFCFEEASGKTVLVEQGFDAVRNAKRIASTSAETIRCEFRQA